MSFFRKVIGSPTAKKIQNVAGKQGGILSSRIKNDIDTYVKDQKSLYAEKQAIKKEINAEAKSIQRMAQLDAFKEKARLDARRRYGLDKRLP